VVWVWFGCGVGVVLCGVGVVRRRGEVMPPQSSRCVAEATPVPDLLGSILSGQSMLLMDSSAVVINRDGTLKAARPGG